MNSSTRTNYISRILLRSIAAFVTYALVISGIVSAPAMAATLFGTTGQGDLHGPDLSTLYEVNPTTGALILIGPVGYVVTGMDYYNGTLYGVTSHRDTSYHSLITIDTTTGAGTPVGSGWGASLLEHDRRDGGRLGRQCLRLAGS